MYTFYFAGDLFDHKDLIGNLLLAEAINDQSKGKYKAILPQNLEAGNLRSVDIRNQDLLKVVECDLALFNFDGTDLDSGTVVEFMLAKFLDIPAILLRTDFRHCGDQDRGGDPWNLMCSGYPRTKVLFQNAMQNYHQARLSTTSSKELINAHYKKLADDIIESFDALLETEVVIQNYETIYQWSRQFAGSAFEELLSSEKLAEIIKQKRLKGLI